MNKSRFLKLGLWDFIKGLIVSILSGLANALAQPFTLKQLGIITLIVFLTYLGKNIVTNSNDEILKPENK
jgi:hypothetical protein